MFYTLVVQDNDLKPYVKLIAAIVDHIVTAPDNKRGGILIFLPGVQEIRQCIEATRGILAGKPADILPLHANL